MHDSSIDDDTILTPFAKLDQTKLGKSCKIGCELRKCTFGDQVYGSHTNITLECVTIADTVNISAGTIFGIRGGQKPDGVYDKKKLSIGSHVFIGLNTSFLPSHRVDEMTIGNHVFIAANTQLRHDVPDGHTVYPTAAVEPLLAKRPEITIYKQTPQYTILDRNKMVEESLIVGT